jgi:hypothetical protein
MPRRLDSITLERLKDDLYKLGLNLSADYIK